MIASFSLFFLLKDFSLFFNGFIQLICYIIGEKKSEEIYLDMIFFTSQKPDIFTGKCIFTICISLHSLKNVI